MKGVLAAAALAAMVAIAGGAAAAAPEDKLMDVDRAFSDHSKQHGIRAAFLAYMAPDGIVIRASAPPLKGRAAYEEATKDGDGTAQLAWTPKQAALSDDGTLGYTWGSYVYSVPQADGPAKETRGRYLTVWRKQADGAWKFIADIGNIDASAAKPDKKD